MYIGPWQEYNLSKSRASRVDERLRPGIEQALLSTLDPETAQKAMEAMIPYFNKPNAPTQARTGNNQNQTPRAMRKRPIHTLPHIPSALSPSTSVISARERSLHAASPLSVRSSQSEPIRYSNGLGRAVEGVQKKPKTPEFTDSIYSHNEFVLPSVKQAPPHTQPAYNSPAMLNLLRLERNSNNQARNQIAKLTGWKVKETDGTNSEVSSTNERTRANKDISNEAKVEQVHKMKQLYMSGGVDNNTSSDTSTLRFPPIKDASSSTTGIYKLTSTNLAQHNSGNTINNAAPSTVHKVTLTAPEAMQPEPLQDEMLLQTPRVGDVDLDDAAFNLVSKYFQSGSNGATGAAVGTDARSYTTMAPTKQTVKPYAKPSAEYDDNLEATDVPLSESQKPLLSPSNRGNSVNLTPHPRTPAQGGGYEDYGGIDGLLAWSSQLELDTA